MGLGQLRPLHSVPGEILVNCARTYILKSGQLRFSLPSQALPLRKGNETPLGVEAKEER